MGKDIQDLQKCEQKILNIYTVLNRIQNLEKIIFASRGSCYMYDIGYGIVDGGERPYGYRFKEYYEQSKDYNQKDLFFKFQKKTFDYFESKNVEFYYLMENPELGFSPKNCMVRPFDFFPNTCRIAYKNYINRQSEYRLNTIEQIKKYSYIHLLDSENLFCDGKYCYAIKDEKMLYADDDHHSLDGSIEQAKYLQNQIFYEKANSVK